MTNLAPIVYTTLATSALISAAGFAALYVLDRDRCRFANVTGDES